MTSPTEVLQHDRNAEIKSYAPVPAEASEAEKKQHEANFAQALREREDATSVGPFERLVRHELVLYLAANYDPRPFGEIAENIRTVLEGRMHRTA